tara:strand:- start:401 stop:928 length:528 start_codon:yes stop_codon:yes gene_type:complete
MGLLQKATHGIKNAAKQAGDKISQANKSRKAKNAAKGIRKAGGQALKEDAKQAKLARKGQKKIDKKMYGGGKKGRANKAADVARKAAQEKMKDVGMSDAATDTSMDGASMNKKYGASMMKKEGASMSGEKYDAKQAYNKDLSASARLHYLENNRADKKAKGGSHRSPIMKHMKGI